MVGRLIKPGGVFAFLAEHRKSPFPDAKFADLFSSNRGRPSVPADVMASVIVLRTLHGMSDSETTDAITFDLRWTAAVGWPLTAKTFHDTTLTYWRRRLAASQDLNRGTEGRGRSLVGSRDAAAGGSGAKAPGRAERIRRPRRVAQVIAAQLNTASMPARAR